MYKDNIPVTASLGRYGPYVKYGNEFVFLGDNDDLFTIELNRALELIRLKEEVMRKRVIKEFPEKKIQALNGRYITDGEKNAKILKETEPAVMTLEQCEEILKNFKP